MKNKKDEKVFKQSSGQESKNKIYRVRNAAHSSRAGALQ